MPFGGQKFDAPCDRCGRCDRRTDASPRLPHTRNPAESVELAAEVADGVGEGGESSEAVSDGATDADSSDDTAGGTSDSPSDANADTNAEDLNAVASVVSPRPSERVSARVLNDKFAPNRGPTVTIDTIDAVRFCSFNISFVGHWAAEDKRSKELVETLESCDLVAIQELTAPPLNVALDKEGQMFEWLPKPDSGCAGRVTSFEDISSDYCRDKVGLLGEWWQRCEPPSGIRSRRFRTFNGEYEYRWVPDGERFGESVWRQDCDARYFVGTMRKAGFHYVLSTGDTGLKARHVRLPWSEWYIAFYRPEILEPLTDADAPHGWTLTTTGDGFAPCGEPDPEETRGLEPGDNPISKCLVANPVFDRVPYAFSFRTNARQDGKRMDFTLINVHLKATVGTSVANVRDAGLARGKEFAAIYNWITEMKGKYSERDFIIVGDTNIANGEELDRHLRSPDQQGANTHGMISLNDQLIRTNVGNRPEPYDHAFLNPQHTIVSPGTDGKMELLILDIRHRQIFDRQGGAFLGRCRDVPEGVERNRCLSQARSNFYVAYSDHLPIMFRLPLAEDDD